MGSSGRKIYEFGNFRLIPADRLLLAGETPVNLSNKAFSVLAYLVEQHGHLVEKRELLDNLWKDSFVEESAVARCIWAIRNALGDGPEKHAFILTVPKRGYRFVADVRVIDAIDLRRRISESELPSGSVPVPRQSESRLWASIESIELAGLIPTEPGLNRNGVPIVADRATSDTERADALPTVKDRPHKVIILGTVLFVSVLFASFLAYLFW